MKTTRAVELAGGKAKLAQVLGITPGAVSQWGEDVPLSRVWQLKTVRKEWFSDETEPAIVSNAASTHNDLDLVHD